MPFVFFSFANTKLPNYIAMVLPALAILVALWFERVRAGADRRAAVISALTIPAFVGCVAFAIGAFSRSNRLDVDLAVVNHQLAFLGVAMLVGSLLTVVAIARRDTAAWSPYVLALTSGALVLFIALIAEPAAEPLKPIPPIARDRRRAQARRRDRQRRRQRRQRFDLLHAAARARHQEQRRLRRDGVRQRQRLDRDAPAGRAAPRRAPARSRHRSAEVVMQTPSPQHARAVLIHVTGPACRHD